MELRNKESKNPDGEKGKREVEGIKGILYDIESGELGAQKQKKDGRKELVDRIIYDISASLSPSEKEKLQVLLSKIENGEPIRGLMPMLKWTHRTSFFALKGIVTNGYMKGRGDRGIQFFLGNGYAYGDIQLIMKDDINTLPPAPEMNGYVVTNQPNMNYFMWRNSAGVGLDQKEFSEKFGEFRKYRVRENDNPCINVPYLGIGGKNTSRASKAPHNIAFDEKHSIDVNYIEAVMIPKHWQKYKDYQQVKKQLKKYGIRVIETPTSESVFDYLGKSLSFYQDGNAEMFTTIMDEEINDAHVDAKIEGGETQKRRGYILEYLQKHNFMFGEEEYEKELVEKGLSRGKTIVGGNRENRVGEENAIIEEKTYLTYVAKTRFHEQNKIKPLMTSISKNIDNPDRKSEDILRTMEKAFYPERYAEGTGTWEGYSLREHTAMVLRQFDRYFSHKDLPGGFNKNIFRILLALHDIGKPLAISYLHDKSKQQIYNNGEIRETVKKLNLEKYSQTLLAIANAPIARLFNPKLPNISPDELYQYFSDVSPFTRLHIAHLFQLSLIYYMCDTSSYTKDAGGKEALDYLFIFDRENHKMRFNIEGGNPAIASGLKNIQEFYDIVRKKRRKLPF